MKKLLSFLLAMFIVVSICVIPAFAQTTANKIDEDFSQVIDMMQEKELFRASIEFIIDVDTDVKAVIDERVVAQLGYTLENAVDENAKAEYESLYKKYVGLYKREEIGRILESCGVKNICVACAVSEDEYVVYVNKTQVYEIADSENVVKITYANGSPVPAVDHKFEDKFIDGRWIMDGIYTYDEVEYHYDENGDIDWALVLGITMYDEPMETYVVLGDRVVTFSGYNRPSALYWVYDVSKEKFYDICKIDMSEYEGLSQAVDRLELGRPIGDANFDGELTITDATYIQRVLASLDKFSYDDKVDGDYYCLSKESLAYVSDFNRDGVRSILDATAIQRKLAKLD